VLAAFVGTTALLLCMPASQKDMLEDHKRTGAYFNAVLENKRMFKDKVVLDVGTGSGILAIFSALAGARKVYAVEATDMAKHATKLVEHNKVCRAAAPSSSPQQPPQQQPHMGLPLGPAALPLWHAGLCQCCSWGVVAAAG
jgi:ribosomal protein L11 methylase PrmA